MTADDITVRITGVVGLRIGIHTGEATNEDHDFYGRSVIVAARVAATAESGEILVSSFVRELTAGTGDVFFAAERWS